MNIKRITIKNKVAIDENPELKIVCNNSTYRVEFHFDAEWDKHDVKTARFVYNGMVVDVPFAGTSCKIPPLSNARMCEIGVYAGDIQTSTPALVSCSKSILDEAGLPPPPADDVYNQIVELCGEAVETANDIEKRANSGEFDGDTPKRGVDYWTPEDKNEVKNYVALEIEPLEKSLNKTNNDVKSLNEKANKLIAELAEFWLSSTFNVQGKQILNVPEIQFIAPNGKDGEVYLRMNKNGSKWLELINLYGGLDIMTTGEVRFTTPSGYADDVRLTGVATPVSNTDAVNKKYVDDHIASSTKEVSVSKIKADSDLDMKNRQILNLAEILFVRAGGTAYFRMNPRGNKDMELINQEGGLYISTLGDVSFYGKNRADGLTQLHFIAPPSADTDAVNKQYVDNQIGSIGEALDELHNYAQSLIGGDS